MKKILFVCTGNTCRSCMAEGIMKMALKKAEDDEDIPRREYKVESRGIFAVDGDHASDKAIAVMNSLFGIDISSHRAKQLVEEDVLTSHLILTMTEDHKHAILLNWPEAESKTFTLKEYAEMSADMDSESSDLFDVPRYDVQDPYRGTIADYEKCAAEINEAVVKIVRKLTEGMKNNKEKEDITDKDKE